METRAIVPQKLGGGDLTKDMVIRCIRDSFRNEEGSLGVSRGYVVKLVGEHDLTEEGLVTLLATRVQSGASFAGMRKLLKRGLDCEAINLLYRVRTEMYVGLPENERSISLGKILKVSETFPELELDKEGLADQLIDIVQRFQGSSAIAGFNIRIQSWTSCARWLSKMRCPMLKR